MGKSIGRNSARANLAKSIHNAPLRRQPADLDNRRLERKADRLGLGKFGAASPVRRIDPKTGEVIG